MRRFISRVLAAVSAIVITAGTVSMPAMASGDYYDFETQLVKLNRGESKTIKAQGGTYPAVYVVGQTSKDTVVGVNETSKGHYDITFYCGADEKSTGYTVYFYKGISSDHQDWHDAVNVHVSDNIAAGTSATAGSTGSEAKSFAATYAGFNQQIASSIRKAASGGTVTVNAGPYTSFYKTSIAAIKERPDVTIVVKFTFDNEDLQIEIPAGAHIENQMDKNGCIGFASLYGEYAVEYTK